MTCSCPSCGRRFVVVKAASEEARCVCGAALATTDLQKGVYEIKRSRRATRRRPLRASASASKGHAKTAMPVEADQGYGESHGYGPAHGGPTGPGDAPAPDTAEIAPAAEAPESQRPAPEAG